MTTAHGTPAVRDAPGKLLPLVYGSSITLSEGEVVPVALTVEAGDRLRVSLPVGAFALRDGRARFVATLDVVGLVAVILGIRVGARGVKATRPLIEALADRIRRRP